MKILYKYIFFVCFFQSAYAITLVEQLKKYGYLELYDDSCAGTTYDSLYESFDAFIDFLQANKAWEQKLYIAKERFIRSKDKHYYSTDFFGLYDESQKIGRNQIAFYYSFHFHEFLAMYYPEFNKVFEITNFFKACFKIQELYKKLFQEAVIDLELQTIFSLSNGDVPILFKVVKYLPLYAPAKPHYDGTALSLFLDSTDNQSLFLSPYKDDLSVDDFSAPLRKFSREDSQRSMLLIPGTLLADYSIYPTPHIVMHSGKTRYATIAFAMRPYHSSQKNDFSFLPTFNY